MPTQDSIRQQMKINSKAAKGSMINCAFCGKETMKNHSRKQFCSRTGTNSCKHKCYRLLKNGGVSTGRTGADPKLDPVKHKRPILDDLKTMTRKQVSAKYGVSKSTLLATLKRWGCHSVIGERNGLTSKALTFEEESMAIEMYKTMTMSGIAEALGVSEATICNALSGGDSRAELVESLGMDVVSVRDLNGERLNTRRKILVMKRKRPAFVMVPIDEWMRVYA